MADGETGEGKGIEEETVPLAGSLESSNAGTGIRVYVILAFSLVLLAGGLLFYKKRRRDGRKARVSGDIK